MVTRSRALEVGDCSWAALAWARARRTGARSTLCSILRLGGGSGTCGRVFHFTGAAVGDGLPCAAHLLARMSLNGCMNTWPVVKVREREEGTVQNPAPKFHRRWSDSKLLPLRVGPSQNCGRAVCPEMLRTLGKVPPTGGPDWLTCPVPFTRFQPKRAQRGNWSKSVLQKLSLNPTIYSLPNLLNHENYANLRSSLPELQIFTTPLSSFQLKSVSTSQISTTNIALFYLYISAPHPTEFFRDWGSWNLP